MAEPEPAATEPRVVHVTVPKVAGVIPVLEVVRGLARAAGERAGVTAAADDPFEHVRALAAQLAVELERLPDLAGGAP